MMTMRRRALATLKMFGPQTHSVEISDYDLVRYMTDLDWIIWDLPKFGSNRLYCLTDAGRKRAEELK